MMQPSTSQASRVEVLIVGAGPAGLMCAAALAKAGVSLRVIDKRAQQVTIGHADALMYRSLEVMHSYGLLDELMREGNRMIMSAMYKHSNLTGIEFVRRDLCGATPGPRARWHSEITLHQGMIETALIKLMALHNIHVDRPVVPLHMEVFSDEDEDPQMYPVKVTIEKNGAKQLVEAKYVIGADGARSWVRETTGIAMEGDDTDLVWGVIDFVPRTNFPDIRNRSIIISNQGTRMLIPREGNKVRVYIQVNDLLTRATVDDITRDSIMMAVTDVFKPYVMEAQEPPEWWSVFGVRQKVASHYLSHHRVIIVGDACHVHSPQIGQGMNAGINDGHNLAWKLTYVLRGWADTSLLQTYEDERRKFACELIKFDKVVSEMRSKKDLSDDQREQYSKAMSAFGSLYTGIGVRYEASIVVQNKHQALAEGVPIGERVPLGSIIRAADGLPTHIHDLLVSDNKFKLFVFAGDIRDAATFDQLRHLHSALKAPSVGASVSTARRSLLSIFVVSYGVDGVSAYVQIEDVLQLGWTNIFVDAENALSGSESGVLHSCYKIGPSGAAIIVRPDGYVCGLISIGGDFETQLDEYFNAFCL